jgi:hypothetical protein
MLKAAQAQSSIDADAHLITVLDSVIDVEAMDGRTD